jgi:hypothetical protein
MDRKKEDLEAAFSLRVAKLQEETAVREKEKMRALETYLLIFIIFIYFC